MTSAPRFEARSLEDQFAALLRQRGIRFDWPERHGGRLDFYLTDFNLYVELKTYSCERLHAQIESAEGKTVIVLVGWNSVRDFAALLDSHA